MKKVKMEDPSKRVVRIGPGPMLTPMAIEQMLDALDPVLYAGQMQTGFHPKQVEMWKAGLESLRPGIPSAPMEARAKQLELDGNTEE